jgi:hypothetical protein
MGAWRVAAPCHKALTPRPGCCHPSRRRRWSPRTWGISPGESGCSIKTGRSAGSAGSCKRNSGYSPHLHPGHSPRRHTASPHPIRSPGHAAESPLAWAGNRALGVGTGDSGRGRGHGFVEEDFFAHVHHRPPSDLLIARNRLRTAQDVAADCTDSAGTRYAVSLPSQLLRSRWQTIRATGRAVPVARCV